MQPPSPPNHPRFPRRPTTLALAALLAASGGCGDAEAPSMPTGARVGVRPEVTPGRRTQYGVPVQVGEGRARTYVVLDQKSGAPVEVGVALDERAMENLPAGYAPASDLLGKTPAEVSVPRMGLHWLDLASPELPPRSRPFTATYISGYRISWDGQAREFRVALRR